MSERKPFLLATTVDFPDDCQHIEFNETLLTQLMDRLQWTGIRRVYWNYYNTGFWNTFAGIREQPATKRTLGNLGNPLAIGCQLAHARGMEFYAIIKPYETGMSHSAPARSPEFAGKFGLPRIGGIGVAMDPWVMEHPDMRVRARAGDLPQGLENMPVTRIQLRQKDMAPLRIKAENIEIWTSADNFAYQRKEVSFTLTEGVDVCRRDVFDVVGNQITSKGDQVRVLDLRGLNLLDPFVVVTTNFDDDSGSFRNTAIEMVRAFGPDDQPLPIVVASHKSVWERPRDFRTRYLAYDCGVGDMTVCLDMTNSRQVCPNCRERGFSECMQNPLRPEYSVCRDGIVAFAKGRNAYLPGSVCEAYPEVQDWWLSWIGECLQAGVDGIDFRISNHSSWTDRPAIYGFNAPILDEYARRYGVNPDSHPYDAALLGEVRGDLYDQFLRRVKRRLSAAGKRMQLHVEIESFRPDAAQARWRTRPGNIAFHWRRWLREGLADAITLMGVNWMPERILADPLTHDVLAEADAAGAPAMVRHPVWFSREGSVHADRLERVYRTGQVAAYNLYETQAMYDSEKLAPDGRLAFYPGLLEGIRQRIEELGLLGI
jgi:hypothetical protein